MSKNVLVISTSLRSGSNSEALADSFLAGAKAAGNHVEKVTLKGKTLAFCKGCMVCQNTRQCVIQDDAVALTEKMCRADVIVFATPIYYYSMSGQMKTLLDRLNPLYPVEYSFRDIYMIATAAENEESTFEKAYQGLQGWVDCFEKAELKGIVTGGGINDANDAVNHADVMQKAYALGKNL